MELSARRITVRKGRKTILADARAAVATREMVGVLGPSGCGKSTLLYALAGFRRPSAGEVRVDGRDLFADYDHFRRRIGFVPQDDIVPTQLRVERVVHFAAELRLWDLPPAQRRARIDGALALLDLDGQRRLRVGQLSGGQRKRVNIAVELVAAPDLLFADEPTSGLDPALEVQLMDALRRMADSGRAIVITTHVMSSIERLDRVVLLHGGRVAYEGPPAAMKRHFGVDDYTKVYERLAGLSPEALAAGPSAAARTDAEGAR